MSKVLFYTSATKLSCIRNKVYTRTQVESLKAKADLEKIRPIKIIRCYASYQVFETKKSVASGGEAEDDPHTCLL